MARNNEKGAGMHQALAAGGLLAAALLVVMVAAATRPAEAAFPGKNGKIAFTSFRDGNYEIYRMNPDGSNQQRLTINSAEDYAPSWQPLP